MKTHFKPRFSLTPRIKRDLAFIEKVRHRHAKVQHARAQEKHYLQEIENITKDKDEVRCYMKAYDMAMNWKGPVTEECIKKLHAVIVGSKKASAYRRCQNAVYDASMKKILYLPPKPEDLSRLMKELVAWINAANYPCPIIAAIAHFGLNSIHPYYDGNGRCARLLTKLILNQKGYYMVLEDYYQKDLDAYYQALSLNDTPNYYTGPAKQSITSWVEYFCKGMAYSCKRTLS